MKYQTCRVWLLFYFLSSQLLHLPPVGALLISVLTGIPLFRHNVQSWVATSFNWESFHVIITAVLFTNFSWMWELPLSLEKAFTANKLLLTLGSLCVSQPLHWWSKTPVHTPLHTIPHRNWETSDSIIKTGSRVKYSSYSEKSFKLSTSLTRSWYPNQGWPWLRKTVTCGELGALVSADSSILKGLGIAGKVAIILPITLNRSRTVKFSCCLKVLKVSISHSVFSCVSRIINFCGSWHSPTT